MRGRGFSGNLPQSPMNALSAQTRDWLDAGLAFFYPPVCQLCTAQRATPAEGYVCPACWQKVRFIVPPCCERCGLPYPGDITTAFECSNCRDLELHFRWARSSMVANDFLRDVIHRYKYSRALWFEPFLADLLVRVAQPVLQAENIAGIVPVPLHPVKQREREFNQAERLAAPLARALGVPVRTDLVQPSALSCSTTCSPPGRRPVPLPVCCARAARATCWSGRWRAVCEPCFGPHFQRNLARPACLALNMKTGLLRFALLALVAASLTACIATKETVYRETERIKVEFENDAAARIFYEAFTRSPESRQRNEKITTFTIPVIIHAQRTEKDSENTAFNAAVRRCDTNGDGKITEQEARIFAAQQK
ncbi:MAG: ComF family protein [Proteobacteria bacterium]|nr:ComF family protein [Pseudomonadota bacterium]